MRACISIHALLAESDFKLFAKRLSNALFLSTLSLRRATKSNKRVGQKLVFLSTLSLRRATNTPIKAYNIIKDFYPRSPCGERPYIMTTIICTASFLSTLSLRRATQNPGKHYVAFRFLSTLSLRRATIPHMARLMELLFLSTLSLRRATALACSAGLER